jgi:hypothetical protein
VQGGEIFHSATAASRIRIEELKNAKGQKERLLVNGASASHHLKFEMNTGEASKRKRS